MMKFIIVDDAIYTAGSVTDPQFVRVEA